MTRDRQAAIDRAIAAYRRIIQVAARHTSAEMIADLIAWHKIYVDEKVDVAALFETAQRRIEVAEAERESKARAAIVAEDPFQDEPPVGRVAADDLMRRVMEGAQRMDNAQRPLNFRPLAPFAEEVIVDELDEDPEF